MAYRCSFNINLWCGRVATEVDIADLPSRRKSPPVPVRIEVDIPPVQYHMDYYTAQLEDIHDLEAIPVLYNDGPRLIERTTPILAASPPDRPLITLPMETAASWAN